MAQYHHRMTNPIESVQRELHARLTEQAVSRLGQSILDNNYPYGSPFGLDQAAGFAMRRELRTGHNTTVREMIDKLSARLARPLLTVQVPDGTWIAHRPAIKEFVRECYAEPEQEMATPPDLQYANLWTKLTVARPMRLSIASATGVMHLRIVSGYSYTHPGLLVAPRATRKLVLS